MSLTQIVEKENIGHIARDGSYKVIEEKGNMPKIYSPKLGKYVPLDSGNPKGEIQKYNVGMGPGSWY
ncbi:hypothetical protein FP803_02900 [Candidatus Woesearchaeota archaeon]|nr:hypothetical protein [Candidatus Woesearchaeota archaeon]MBU3942037.1 hypothetical protein [Nanoarchaeota archaeon]